MRFAKEYSMSDLIDAKIPPRHHLKMLSRQEVAGLKTASSSLNTLFHRCAYAILNCGSLSDDDLSSSDAFQDFSISIDQFGRGIVLDVRNAPSEAFVDGEVIRGIREHLFAVLRDIVYLHNEIQSNPAFNLDQGEAITNAVFHILRNAHVLKPQHKPNLIICWGGHSINRDEYEYTKQVGYQLGLRKLDVGTGCGPGAMKGPMKGATIGHAKQHHKKGRYVGISEPGIIAAESPNPIVNELVILPDIEKRLEAFVRMAHGIIVFPGGPGTAEEILYLLGILLHPDNQDIPFPLVFSGPPSAKAYFEKIDAFIGSTLGSIAQSKYTIIIDDPVKVAQTMKQGVETVFEYRKKNNDSYIFNWLITIEHTFQKTFSPTHENMAALSLISNQPTHILAANLRSAFSGIVAGNVKQEGVDAIKLHGPFELHGDSNIIEPLDDLLKLMVRQQRMKIACDHYKPCYRILS